MPKPAYKHPQPFLEVRCEVEDLAPTLTGWCAGYDGKRWRAAQLAKHILEWLPEFALKFSEWSDLGSHNAMQLLGKAASSVYTSKDYERRGEFGEILLHAMIRQRFGSLPAISKYFYKDASNDTIKGFDAVHIVDADPEWELWLGESKFYADINKAIADAVKSLREHTKRDYSRAEFVAITNKIDDASPKALELRALLHKNTPLDKIFARICIPVLLTYDSPVVASHREVSAAYGRAFEAEVRAHRDTFAGKELPANVTIRLMLLPLESKAELVTLMDEALKQCQATF